MPNKNFVILIGGPGQYFACDTVHDKSWSNYVVPMQLAAQKKLYKLEGETVHWVVFSPAYRNRWSDDSRISSSESREYGLFGKDRYTKDWKVHRSDTWLHQHRKETADKVMEKRGPDGKNATSYLDRVSQICRNHGIVYHAISQPVGFWNYLKGFQDASISRVWYCGHAAPSALFLDLDHELPESACTAISGNIVTTQDIINHSSALARKFSTTTDKASKFFGCNTASFAQQWNQEFKVTAEGADNKITFQAIYNGDQTKNVLERLKTHPTKSGPPNWRSYAKP